ncbi:MAG: acetate--CoA ligase family protein, partial [Acidobacteriota bacterium]|nr:acetate--CoA ligase family protein [Acidobacteriota bacterium]
SVVALSGGVGAVIMQALFDLDVGMRMYASNGNASDISIPEILRYWGKDDGCRAIILYTEGFSDPREFLEVAKEVTALKPVLAMKAGRTAQGAKAASSHTGSLAGVDIATELIFEKTGILSFDDEEDMARAAMAFATQPIPKGNRVGIITNTGGPAVIATDVFGASGLDVPKFSEKTIQRLKDTQLPEAALENPIDVVATAGGAQFRAALDILLDEEDVDSIFINFVTAPFTDTHAVAREIAAVGALGRKPIVCNFMTDLTQERYQETRRILQEGGIPCYANPTAAAKALVALAKYGRLRRREIGQPEPLSGIDAARAHSILQAARAAGRQVLGAREVYSIFEAYGIPVAPWRVAENVEEVLRAGESIGYPVVVKVDAADLDHKSDAGGVAVNLQNPEEVRLAVEDMQARLGAARTLSFLIQKFLPGGRELIIGASPSRGLGHLVMFGLGGIYVETLKDVVFKIAPVTRVEALEMLSGIKTAALLDGLRGQKGVDKPAVVDLIQRVSRLVSDLPVIQEMDLNPVMAFEQGAFAVDGRIRI